jgi:hypothetical protein
MLLPTLELFADVIKSYRVIHFEKAGASFKLRAQVLFVDDSLLHIRETFIAPAKRKYAYHWQNPAGELIIRWDNAPDWEVETFPHHKHLGEQQNVEPSYERTLEQVLAVINDAIENRKSKI